MTLLHTNVPFGAQILALALCFTLVVLFLSFSQRTSLSKNVSFSVVSPNCYFHFTGYSPSRWEQQWIENADLFQTDPNAICKKLKDDSGHIDTWLQAISKHKTDFLSLDATVFSKFVYENNCTKKKSTAVIEPLAGDFRHPHAIPACAQVLSKAKAQDRSYLLINGMNSVDFTKQYPGKKYLFDLGTSRFSTGLQWFTSTYESFGILFDEIWAWEVNPISPDLYWKDVPSKYHGSLHFYNVPATADKDDERNPLAIMKRKFRPGDFLVLKLDIDNSPLENSLVDQIQRNPLYTDIISEMMFEMHYSSPHVNQWFGASGKGKTWMDVLQTFTALRHAGIRVHYWP